MAANPRIRRLTLVPFSHPDDELRRYRLARMDEIALATPPDRASARTDAQPKADEAPPTPPGAAAPPA
jgi:hypothetical protein